MTPPEKSDSGRSTYAALVFCVPDDAEAKLEELAYDFFHPIEVARRRINEARASGLYVDVFEVVFKVGDEERAMSLDVFEAEYGPRK